MISQVVQKQQVSTAIALLKSKLKPDLQASNGIWADVNLQRGFGFYGVSDSGRVAVEINVPPCKKNPMGLIGRERNRLYLCHNGRLNPRLKISQSNVF
jgi:hypothetical protein